MVLSFQINNFLIKHLFLFSQLHTRRNHFLSGFLVVNLRIQLPSQYNIQHIIGKQYTFSYICWGMHIASVVLHPGIKPNCKLTLMTCNLVLCLGAVPQMKYTISNKCKKNTLLGGGKSTSLLLTSKRPLTRYSVPALGGL